MVLKSINPATEAVLGEVEITDKKGILNTVKNAKKAFIEWKKLSADKRYELLSLAIKKLTENSREISELVTNEMGKPIRFTKPETENAIGVLEDHKKYMNLIKDEEAEEKDLKSVTRYEPIGTFACISPWNYPILTPLGCIIPALLAGNTIVFKPSELTPLTGLELIKPFQEALPQNVINIVIGDSETGKQLVNSDVDGIALTGSAEAGNYVAEHARMRKTVLELGGSDPFIVCEDADLERTINGAVSNRFRNAGQVCISAKRIFVMKPIAKEFISGVVEKTKKLKIGNGIDPKTDMGPLVSKEQRDRLEKQVKDAVSKGAKVLYGGKRPDNLEKGFFYLPTIITDISPDMKVTCEEVFGPVMVIREVNNIEEAVELANNTIYGLGGSIWSGNINKALDTARQIESGMVWVNDVDITPTDFYWGGMKQSSSVRSRHAILDFVKIKQITAYTGKEKRNSNWF